jgi:hypothetical protein
VYLANDKYGEITEKVKIAKQEKKKTAISYRRFKRHYICTGDD